MTKKQKVIIFAVQITQPVTVQFSPPFSPKRSDRLWGTPSLVFNGYRDTVTGVVRPGREADHPSSPSAKVKNGWSHTSTYRLHSSAVSMEHPQPTFLSPLRETKLQLTQTTGKIIVVYVLIFALLVASS
jgi:hypothetical protein